MKYINSPWFKVIACLQVFFFVAAYLCQFQGSLADLQGCFIVFEKQESFAQSRQRLEVLRSLLQQLPPQIHSSLVVDVLFQQCQLP